MNKSLKIIFGALLIAAVTSLAWLTFVKGANDDSTQTATPSPPKSTTSNQFSFENPKKSAHYESNTPSHGSVLAGVPVNVVIDFNFDLAAPSSISIMSNDEEYGTGDTIIDDGKLSMRRRVNPLTPDGLYTVNYNACWPDGSCHDGSFQFAIDRKRAANFTNIKNQPEVTIRMTDIKFNPANIRISKGTKVTWVNDDDVDHFVNTDSHPAHTFLPGMNSRSLANGASYSFTFNEAGFYPYHCSAHANNMSGAVLVEG